MVGNLLMKRLGLVSARLMVIAVLVLASIRFHVVDSAYAATCTETTKFVYETSGNPDESGSNFYFGIRGSANTFNHLPICSGGAVAESFFVRLTADYTNWVETGTQQLASDSSAHTHSWGEWRYYPSPVQYHLYDSVTGILTTGTTYSWMLQNGNATSWDLYIVHASSPDGASWIHVANTGNLAAYGGLVESELSRYGTGDASDYVTYLEEQRDFGGGYVGWQHLGCDYSQRSILDWAVVKVNNSQWYMIHQPPGPGYTC